MQVLLGIAIGLLVAALFGVSSDPDVSRQIPVETAGEIEYRPADYITVEPYHDIEPIRIIDGVPTLNLEPTRIGNEIHWVELHTTPSGGMIVVPYHKRLTQLPPPGRTAHLRRADARRNHRRESPIEPC